MIRWIPCVTNRTLCKGPRNKTENQEISEYKVDIYRKKCDFDELSLWRYILTQIFIYNRNWQFSFLRCENMKKNGKKQQGLVWYRTSVQVNKNEMLWLCYFQHSGLYVWGNTEQDQQCSIVSQKLNYRHSKIMDSCLYYKSIIKMPFFKETM